MGDPDDHYNITVSMMVRRIPPPRADKVLDEWNGGEMIAPKLDKGFPYDDGDNTITDAAPRFKKTGPVAATTVGKLMDSNVTKGQLKNLIQDRTSPVAQELVQIEGDGDNVFQLMDSNVTKGQMKNLITDKPAPITVKLAQTGGDGRPDSVVTRSVPNSGRLSAMNTELTPTVPMPAPPSCRWRGSMCTTTRPRDFPPRARPVARSLPPAVSLCPVPSSSISSLAPWTV